MGNHEASLSPLDVITFRSIAMHLHLFLLHLFPHKLTIHIFDKKNDGADGEVKKIMHLSLTFLSPLQGCTISQANT